MDARKYPIALFVLLSYTAHLRAQMVERPFFSETARVNFSRCFPDVSKEDLSRLKNITLFGYLPFPAATPCTTPNCNPDPRLNEFTSTRIIRFDASQMNPSVAKANIYALEGGDCSYNRIRSFSSSVGLNSIVYSYSPYHKERACNYGVVFDKGEVSADVTTTITLQPDFSTTANTVIANKKTSSNFSFGNVFADSLIGGLLLGPIGVFVGAVALPEITKQIEANAAFGGPQFDRNFGGFGVNLYEYSKFQQRIDKLGQFAPLKEYATNRPLSGFHLTDKQDLIVEVQQQTQVYDAVRKDFADTRKAEIEFLSALNEVAAKKHIVRKGENLWQIVRNEYLDARLYLLIAEINNIGRNENVVPGQTLDLPRWHQLCTYFGGNPRSVKKGESLWAKSKKGQIPTNFNQIRTHSGKKDLIYPLEILTLKQADRKNQSLKP